MNQPRNVQTPPLLETDVAYNLPPDVKREVVRAKQLPTWKRRQRIRRHINARLFTFTIVSLFIGLSIGYYMGNNRSLDGFVTRLLHAKQTNEMPVTTGDNAGQQAVNEASRESNAELAASTNQGDAGQPDSNDSSPNQPTFNQADENRSFSNDNFDSDAKRNSGSNPFEEYNNRTGKDNNREPSTNLNFANVTLAASGLAIPVAGIKREQLVDTFSDARSENRSHDAIDIIAARGTPVLAATDGRLARFYESKKGGLTIYQIAGDGRTVFYYAHLDGFAEGLQAGQELKRGQVIGYVGDTGNAAPGNCHLHFAIWIANDPKRYWEGDNLNPYPLLAK